jgi:hypothetical protein
LSERARIAVHHQTGLAVKIERDGMLLQFPREVGQSMLGQFARVKIPPMRDLDRALPA